MHRHHIEAAFDHSHVFDDGEGEHDHGYGQHAHSHGPGHSHGLVDRSIVRSREGVRVVAMSLAVLFATAAAQGAVFALAGSVALLSDLIHNVGDALTAIPLGAAFFLRSARGERAAGLFVVFVIFASACVALYETIVRVIHPVDVTYLGALAAAGVVGFLGNELAAQIRIRGGKRLQSPALIADGNHARIDGFVSLGVVVSALGVAVGAPIIDPLVGFAITLVILNGCWKSWVTIRRGYGVAQLVRVRHPARPPGAGCARAAGRTPYTPRRARRRRR